MFCKNTHLTLLAFTLLSFSKNPLSAAAAAASGAKRGRDYARSYTVSLKLAGDILAPAIARRYDPLEGLANTPTARRPRIGSTASACLTDGETTEAGESPFFMLIEPSAEPPPLHVEALGGAGKEEDYEDSEPCIMLEYRNGPVCLQFHLTKETLHKMVSFADFKAWIAKKIFRRSDPSTQPNFCVYIIITSPRHEDRGEEMHFSMTAANWMAVALSGLPGGPKEKGLRLYIELLPDDTK